MQVEKVHFVMNHSRWTKLKKEVLSDPLIKTALFLEKGNFKSAAEQLGVYLQKMDKEFSNMGNTIPLYNSVFHIQKVLETKSREFETKSREFETRRRDLKTKQTGLPHKQIAITCRNLIAVESLLPAPLSDGLKRCIKRAEAPEKKTGEEDNSQ